MTNNGFSGAAKYDPKRAGLVDARRSYIRGSVYDFVDSLPVGESSKAAEVMGCIQPDNTSCFYAALGGVAATLNGQTFNISDVVTEARSERLIGPDGADTSLEAQMLQQDFVRRLLGVNINFINPFFDQDALRVKALTTGLVEEGTHVLFGLPAHWVALNGIRNRGAPNSEITWTGMDPAGARRIGTRKRPVIGPQTIVDRLLADDMPVVTVLSEDSGFTPQNNTPTKDSGFRPR